MSDHETTSSRRRFHSGLLRPVIVLAAIVAVLWVTGCMERLFYHPSPGPATPPAHLRDAESVWFNSADGTRLHGWFIPARSQDPASAAGPRLPLPPGEGGGEGAIKVPSVPTILHVHGNAGNVESHVGFTEHLPAAGFNLFIFAYRGYVPTPRTPRPRGANSHRGTRSAGHRPAPTTAATPRGRRCPSPEAARPPPAQCAPPTR